jgi:predicted aminopeptidase
VALRLRRVVRWLFVGLGSASGLIAVVLGVALLIPGCSVGYVTRQSVTHLRVLAAREPLAEAIADGDIPDEWLPKIETIQDAKRFGAEELDLPTEDLYETISLAPVGPTWIVTGCPKDALTPVTWWFPFVGRVAYKGFYNKDGAERLTARLEKKGNDVQTYPTAAFSTLGWFSDPIRPSMLEGSAARLANLVLHESAHRVLYWKGQTAFNESFASFVGDVGAMRYLEARFGEDCEVCRAVLASRADAPLFGALIEATIERLEALYAEPISRDEKIRRREEVFAWAQEEHARVPWQGESYSRFPARDLDNAVILSYRRYGAGQEVFDALLARCDGDLPAAIAFVRDLGWTDLPGRERREAGPLEYLEARLEEGADCSSGNLQPHPEP